MPQQHTQTMGVQNMGVGVVSANGHVRRFTGWRDSRTIREGEYVSNQRSVQPVGWVEPTGPARSGRPFTANLAERRLRLLVDDIVSAKADGFRCRSTHPAVFTGWI